MDMRQICISKLFKNMKILMRLGKEKSLNKEKKMWINNIKLQLILNNVQS